MQANSVFIVHTTFDLGCLWGPSHFSSASEMIAQPHTDDFYVSSSYSVNKENLLSCPIYIPKIFFVPLNGHAACALTCSKELLCLLRGGSLRVKVGFSIVVRELAG